MHTAIVIGYVSLAACPPGPFDRGPFQVFDECDSDDDGALLLEEFITCIGMLKKSVLEVRRTVDTWLPSLSDWESVEQHYATVAAIICPASHLLESYG